MRITFSPNGKTTLRASVKYSSYKQAMEATLYREKEFSWDRVGSTKVYPMEMTHKEVMREFLDFCGYHEVEVPDAS